MRVDTAQGDWAARSRQVDYASDSSESSSESPPTYSRSFAHDPRFQEDVRHLNRLPNVGGSLLSQLQVGGALTSLQ